MKKIHKKNNSFVLYVALHCCINSFYNIIKQIHFLSEQCIYCCRVLKNRMLYFMVLKSRNFTPARIMCDSYIGTVYQFFSFLVLRQAMKPHKDARRQAMKPYNSSKGLLLRGQNINSHKYIGNLREAQLSKPRLPGRLKGSTNHAAT